MSSSKEGHDTEQHQNATPTAPRLKAIIAAGLAFFVFSGTLAACGSSRPQASRVVPLKATSAVFYEQSDDALPKAPAPSKPKPPTPPTPTVPPIAPPAASTPTAPVWTPTYTPPTPKPTQPKQRTYSYTPSYETFPRDAVQEYARSLVGSSYEFTCLAHIVDRESGWNPQAINESGAFGVPQALPGAKMSSAGPDWRTNPETQIRWMVGYLHSRYGSACNAWGFWQSHGWY